MMELRTHSGAYRAMQQAMAALVCAAVVGLSGCGGGGGGAPPATPPSISNLSYQPTLVAETNAGGFTVNGWMEFNDGGGDIVSLTLRIVDAQGVQRSSSTSPIQGIAGQTSGVIAGSVLAAAPTAGTYTFHISVTDSAGAVSNELSGPFDVVPVSSRGRMVATTGPGATSLQAAEGLLFWTETGTVALRYLTTAGGGVKDLATRVVQIQAFAFVGADLIWEDDRPVGWGICGTNTIERVIHRTTAAGVTRVLATGLACLSDGSEGIAVDATSVYWVNSTVSPNVYSLNATPLVGGTTTTVVSGFTPIRSLVSDGAALYWMEGAYPDPGVIRRRTPSNGRIDTVASFPITGAWTFAVDANNVYYSTPNFPRTPLATETLMAQPFAGGAPLVLASAISLPTRLAAGSGQLVWIDASGVRAMSTSGGSVSTLADTGTSTALDVLVTGSQVVWTETTGAVHGESGAMKRVPLAGGAIETLVQGGDAPRRLVLDAQSRLNWNEGGPVGLVEGFSRVAVLTPGGVTTVLSGISSPAPAFRVAGPEVLIADRWRVKRLPVAGGMPDSLVADDGPIVSVTTDNDWIYWNRAERLSARKAPRAGGPVTVLADGGPSLPVSGSSIHLGTDGKLYWVSGSNVLASVPSQGGPLAVVTQNASPCVVIDDVNAYFNAGGVLSGDPTGITRMPLAGGAPTPLASGGSCLYPATGPSVLSAFVLDDRFLYWRGSILGTDAISRVSTDGGRVIPVLIFDESAGATGGATSIAVDATRVYWTYPSLNEIRASAK